VFNPSETPLVCICIPTYNAEKTIHETLNSIINQSYSNFDIHIVDNASSDKTIEIVNNFKFSRLYVHLYDVNVSGEENFNRCIKLASGKYTAIFHADDVYNDNIIEKQVEILEKYTEVGAVFTEALKINENGDVIGQINSPKQLIANFISYDFRSLFKLILKHSNFLICSSVLVRTEIYTNYILRWKGEIFLSSADLDVWLRISQFHKIGVILQPLVFYRISNTQGSALVRIQTGRSDFFKVIDFYFKHNNVLSFLSNRDIINLEALERRDCVMRALNLYLKNEELDAIELINKIKLINFNIVFQGKRGVPLVIIILYLKFIILFKLKIIGKLSIIYLKNKFMS
jgi:glycosyltransferase involved in cell wall biosynthesis